MTDFPSNLIRYLTEFGNTAEAPEPIMHRLADFFDASGIGISHCNGASLHACHEGNPRTPFPWQTDLSLISRARESLAAVSTQDKEGEWLASVAWDPRHGEPLLVWLFRAGNRGWKPSHAALLPLAAQMLVRCTAQNMASTSSKFRDVERLENIAAVTSRLSHDFGNFLTGISGFTELSVAQAPPEGLLHDYLQEVLQAARQGSEWIRRLHRFCRRNGQYSWPTELSSAVEENQLRMTGDASVRWEKKIPGDLPLLGMDADSLQGILTELANNTRDACNAGKRPCTLTIEACSRELTDADCGTLLGSPQPGNFVEITVADDGPGFTPESRSKLFQEVFYSTKPRHRGLGLLVVYGILNRFHGGLSIEASAEKGARVRLYIPAAPVESNATAGEPAHLLVVHPDPLLFESLRKILEWQGYRVTVALTPQVALSTYQAQAQPFALVVTEAMLPQLSGFDLARRILDRDPKANFLFLYTQSSFHGVAEEEMLKRFMLLRWPLAPSAFVQAVRTTLAKTAGSP